MLLNLSNHPSALWPASQKSAALAVYGEIDDLPFPAIDPEADTEAVEALADAYVEMVLQRLAGRLPNAVHLMGEMTFTAALTSRLQKRGVAVLCSTTRRNVIEEQDGKKTTRFEFVRFRSYPLLVP